MLYARSRPAKVIVLTGGRDFWSNGIHLNLIEAAEDPAAESWRNINAMNELVYAVLTSTDRLTIAALYGSAGAGGVMLALAAGQVFARDGIVLNPHYKGMGGLYGSEYWTYSLPKRVGPEKAMELTEQCLPISVREAQAIGLIDDVILDDDLAESPFGRFRGQITRIAENLARSPQYRTWLAQKQATREQDERFKLLKHFRSEELEEMKKNFWGEDQSYHLARAAFVRKQPRPACIKHDTALETASGNEHCAEVRRITTNRYVDTHVGWSRTRTERHAA